jgi:hypothetical protein
VTRRYKCRGLFLVYNYDGWGEYFVCNSLFSGGGGHVSNISDKILCYFVLRSIVAYISGNLDADSGLLYFIFYDGKCRQFRSKLDRVPFYFP